MKAIVGVVIGFFLRVFALVAVSSVIVAAVRFGVSYDPAAGASPARLFPLLLDSAGRVLFPGAVVGFGFSLSALIRVRRLRRVAGTALFLVFVAGVAGFIRYAPAISDAASLRGGALAPVVRVGAVTRFPNADLFVTDRDGYSLLNVHTFYHDEPRGFRYDDEAFVDPFAREIEIPDFAETMSMDEALNGPTVVFQPPPLLESAAGFFVESSQLLREQLDRSEVHFWVSVLAFCFAASGAWTFAHMSRWPFLNAVVTLVALVFLPPVHVFLHDPDVERVFATVFADMVRPFAPSIVLVAFGLGLFVLGLVGTSPQRLRLETEG
ncbi:MAG: hypothetical protein ACOCRN_04395 [Spirochaetia bacterium]